MLDLRAGVLAARSSGPRRRADGARPLDAAGVVRAARDRGDLLRGRGARRTGAHRRAVDAGRQRAGARADATIPRAAAALRAPLVAEYHAHHDLEAALGHRHALSGLRVAAAIDHIIEGQPGTAARPRASPTWRGVTVSTELAPGQPLRSSSCSPTAGRASARCPRLRDQVDAALAAAQRTGWDGLLRRAARVPGRRLGAGRHRDRRRPRAAAGGALRPLPGRAGGRPRRAAGHPGQGPHRPRLRRAHVLGHGDLHPAGADLHGARRGARRARWRHSTLDLARDARASCAWRAPPFRGGRSAARNAPATGRRARRRSTSTPTSRTRCVATSSRPTTRSSSAALASTCSSRRRACGSPRAPRRGRRLSHRRRDRARRVHGPGRQQRVHQPDGGPQPAIRRRRGRAATPSVPPSSRRRATRSRRGARPPSAMVSPSMTSSVSRRSQRASPATDSGTSRRPRRTSTRCCCTSRTTCCTPARWSSRPTSCSPCTCAATPSTAEQKRRDFDYYERITVRDSSLSACIQAVVAAEVGHLDLAYDYFRETALVDLRDLAGNTADGLHLPRWRGLARRRWPGSAACAITATGWPSRRACRATHRVCFGCCTAAGGCGSISGPTARATSCWPANHSRFCTTASWSSWRPRCRSPTDTELAAVAARWTTAWPGSLPARRWVE